MSANMQPEKSFRSLVRLRPQHGAGFSKDCAAALTQALHWRLNGPTGLQRSTKGTPHLLLHTCAAAPLALRNPSADRPRRLLPTV